MSTNIPLDNTAYYPPITQVPQPTPPQGLPGQTPLPIPGALGAPGHYLAQAMRNKNTKPPFAGVLAKAQAPASGGSSGAASPAGATAPQVTPQTTTPDGVQQAQQSYSDAEQAVENFPVYQEKDVPYQQPTLKKDDPLRSAIDLIAAGLLARRAPRAAGQIGNMESGREQKYQTDYDTATKEADAKWTRETAAEEKKAANSDREYNALLGRETAAEKNVYNQQQLAERTLNHQRATANTQRLTDARVAHLAEQARTDRARLLQTATRDANNFALGKSRIAVTEADNTANNINHLTVAGMHNDTALELANRSYNMHMAIARMQQLGLDQRWKGSLAYKQQFDSLKQLSTNYDNIIKAAAQPGAADAIQAQAAALLAPPAPGQPSEYDKVMSGLQRLSVGQGAEQLTTGISPVTSGIVSSIRDDATTYSTQLQDAATQAIDDGTFSNGLIGGEGAYGAAAGGGVTLNVNTGGQQGNQPGGAANVAYTGPPGGMSTVGPVGFGQPPDNLVPTIQDAAQRYGQDPGIMSRMLAAESGYQNVDAKGNLLTSKRGAQGIAQFKPETAKQYGVILDPKDPNSGPSGIYGMANYLADLQQRYAKYGPQLAQVYAVAAYNAGPDTVDRVVSLPYQTAITHLPVDTQNYLKSVFGMQQSGNSYTGGDPRFKNANPEVTQLPGTHSGKAGANTHNQQPPGDPSAAAQQKIASTVKAFSAAYDSDPNLQGQSFDQVWPQYKQHLENKQWPPQAIAAVQTQLKTYIDHAYAASVVNQKNQNARAAVSRAQATIPGMDANAAQAYIAADPAARDPNYKAPVQAPPNAQQKIAQTVAIIRQINSIQRGGNGQPLTPEQRQQLIQQTVMSRLGVSAPTADQIIAAATKPQPGQAPQQPIAQLGITQ